MEELVDMASASRTPGRATRPSRRAMKDLLRPVGLEGPKTVVLPAVIGAGEAGSLREELLAARGHMVDLDGAGVARLGGLGLQVLLSAHATWKQDGQRLRLVQPSDALLQSLDLLGAKHFDPAHATGASL